MIAHGSSQARTIKAAIREAKTYAEAQVNQAIVDELAAYEQLHGHSEKVDA